MATGGDSALSRGLVVVGKRGLPVRAAPDSLAAKVGMLRAGASCRLWRRTRR